MQSPQTLHGATTIQSIIFFSSPINLIIKNRKLHQSLKTSVPHGFQIRIVNFLYHTMLNFLLQYSLLLFSFNANRRKSVF